MLSIADSGSLITIGTSWRVTAFTLGVISCWAVFVLSKAELPKSIVFGVLLTAFPVVLVHNHGDLVQLTPQGVRETQWFREVRFIEWRHIKSAWTRVERYETKRNSWHQSTYLVLSLKTRDSWSTRINGLNPEETERVLAFIRKRAGHR